MKSLQNKILLVVLLPIVLTMAVAGVTSFNSIMSHVEKQKKDQMTFMAYDQVRHLRESLKTYSHDFALIAQGEVFTNYIRTFQEKSLVHLLVQKRLRFPVLAVVEEGAILIHVSRGHINFESQWMDVGSLAKKAKDVAGSVVFQVASKHPEFEEAVLELAIYKEGYYAEESDVLLYGAIPLSQLTLDLTKEPFGETGFFSLASKEAILLACPFTSRVGSKIRATDPNGEKLIDAIHAGREMYSRASLFGLDVVVATYPMEKMGWSAMVSLPYEEYIAAPNALLRKAAFILIVAVIIAACIAYFLALAITIPLRKLEMATAKVAEGEFGYQVDIKTGDELEQLAGAFNGMGRNLDTFVTNKKKLTEELRLFKTFVETSGQGMGWVDTAGTILYVNPALSRLFGEKHQDAAFGKNVALSYYDEEEQQRIVEEIFPYVAEHGAWLGDLTIQQADGKRIATSNGLFAILDDDQKPLFYGNIVTDITERIEANNALKKMHTELEDKVLERTVQLRNARDEAEAANHAKSEFLTNMSHEFRTPMHGILSYASFGIQRLDKVPKEKILEYFHEIADSGNRLMLLLNDLLDLAKLEAGRMNYTMLEQEINDTVSLVANEFQASMQKKEISLQLIFQQESLVLLYDAGRIGQVIRNLIANSIKFSERGKGIRVETGITKLSVDGKQQPAVMVSVLDQGIGIPEEELDTIFDKFIQSSKTKTGAGGTGLGLAICKQIIEDHNGIFQVTNNREGGANFTFILPN